MTVAQAKANFRKLVQYRIRTIREGHGFSRKEVAHILGIPEETYKKWEIGGTGTMPAFYFVKFCAIFRSDLHELLDPLPNTIEKEELDEIFTDEAEKNSSDSEE